VGTVARTFTLIGALLLISACSEYNRKRPVKSIIDRRADGIVGAM
jgi:hypothetical protein